MHTSSTRERVGLFKLDVHVPRLQMRAAGIPTRWRFERVWIARRVPVTTKEIAEEEPTAAF